MLVTTCVEPTVENAPCPPFFVENVYDIFITTAESSGLNATIIEAVWDKCVEQFPQLTTTTTTTSTTQQTTTQTTTSSTPTTTTEQTTTSTTPTTTEQTTTSTTPTTTTEQTTTSITPTTTEQTTTSSTPTTTTEQTTTSTTHTTAQQTTTSTTPTTSEQATTSTTPTTTTEQTTTSTTHTTTQQTTSSTTLTTSKQTTTSTTPTTAQQTTTSTTPTTTKQTTTSTTPPTTTEQTTTSTTHTTTQQTTSSTTPTTTEQTTTSTTPTTAQQTTTSTTPTTTEQTTTSTTQQNRKTNSTANLSSMTKTTLTPHTSRSSSSLTFSFTTEFKTLSTDVTTGQASLTKCDIPCLVGSVLFCMSLFVGIIVAVKCLNAKRRRKHRFKHSNPKHKIGGGRSGKYIPKFPNINRHAYLNGAPLAFENPTFIEHNGFSPVFHVMKTEQLHRRTPAQERRHRQKTFLDEDLRNGQAFFYRGKRSNHIDACRSMSPNRTRHVDHYNTSIQMHNHLPSTINNYVPKVIMPDENEYSFGIIKFDSNSGLPKIDIYQIENETEIPDYPGSNGQESDAFDEEKNNSDMGFVTGNYNLDDIQRGKSKKSNTVDLVVANGFIKAPIRTKENNKEEKVKTKSVYWPKKETEDINSFEKNHGLPRIPFDGTGDYKSFNVSTVPHCLPRTAIDAVGFTGVSKMASNSYLLYSGQNKQDVLNVYDNYNSVSKC